MTNNHSHPVALITQYRLPLMGLAVIWLIYNHIFAFGPGFFGSILNFVKLSAVVAGDIFFFLSGMGLMMGWLKKRYTLKAFYSRRLLRILPAYWIVILFGLAARSVLGAPCPMGKFAADFFCVGFLTRNTMFGLWFIDCIIIFYILFPLIAYFMTKSEKSFKYVVIVTCVSLAAAIFLAWIDYGSYLIVFILRWPAFFLGTYIGLCIGTHNYTYIDKVSPRVLCLLLLTGFMLFLIIVLGVPYVSKIFMWKTGIWYYPCVIIIFPFCYFAAHLCHLCKDYYLVKKLMAFLSVLGKSAWEIYIVHVVALNITRGRFTAPDLFVVTVAIVFAVLLRYLLQSNYVLSLFKTTETRTS